ncbi:MAG: sulfatase-like hydrolase/transferase [Pirellulales bacterium]|nr:sulfatase-like hydrolase/transferase [Pirellulales bacterium]
MTEATPSHEKPVKRSRWPERLWIFLALCLLFASLGAFLARRYEQMIAREAITGEIAISSEKVEHIDAPRGALRDYNVLIITTDTTRADHIGCYGNRGVKTPVLDQLAREGVLCAHATTPSPSTLPAHSSLLTGLYPAHHGVRANGTFRLQEKVTTLAESLKSEGYQTAAFISAFVLDSRFGLGQGFDLYHDDLTKGMQYSDNMFRERAAELTNEPATKWLRENAGGKKPFFMWVHYFDPHAVYMAPEPFRSEYKRNPYNGEIAYVDSQIGALLSQLKELGVRDRTLVVYTADHGEGLGEHGEQTHSLLVYDGTLHIPMIWHAPAGIPLGKLLERQTCLTDVVPTVFHLLGKEIPKELDGTNLCEQPATSQRAVQIETIATMTMHGWAPLIGVRRDDYKYILAPTPELYNLAEDPHELKNLHDEKPEVVKELRTQLVNWLGDDPYLAGKGGIDLENMEIDAEAMRKLAALGYVKTTSDDDQEVTQRLDPKDQVKKWETVQQAIHKKAEGDPLTAITMLESVLAESPADVYSRSILANAYEQVGDSKRAMSNLQLAIEHDSNNEGLWLSVAGIHLTERKFKEAEAALEKALEIEPESAQAYLMRGQIAINRGQEAEAMRLYKQAADMDPGTVGPGAYNAMGIVHLVYGRFEEARQAFNDVIRLDSLNGAAHDGLANILIHEGKSEEAMQELQLALRFDPNQKRALATLASLLSLQGDQDEALKVAKKALKVAPKFGTLHNNLGLIYRRKNQLDLAEKHYKLAIEYEPHQDESHVNLAQLYRRQGKEDEAIEQFHAAVKASPWRPNAIALANLGSHHLEKKEYPKALACYLKAVQVNPDYAIAHRNLASVYALPEYFRPKLVVFHLRRTLELDPNQQGADKLRDILKQAEEDTQKQGGDKEEPIKEEPIKEEPIKEEPKKEEPAG